MPEFRSAKRQLLIGLVIGLAVLWTADIGVASADEGEQPQTGSITFHLGDNFVGWVAETISVEDLFAAIPQIELIYTWDAEGRRWLMAAPALPVSLRTLRGVEPGAGLVVRLSGDEPVEWERPITPVKGLVELRQGINWVAWSGLDNRSITEVLRGVGGALTQVRSGDLTDDPERPASADDWPLISRGDALQVTVSRDVNWLQPTYVMPSIEFPGGAPAQLQERVRDDVSAVLDFYARTWGIQADADSTILVPRDVTALIQRCHEVACTSEQELAIQALWDKAGGWAGGREMVVKQGLWSENGTGRYVLSHEYAHWLQAELAKSFGTPVWLLEGVASWADELHRVDETDSTPSQWRDQLTRRVAQGPTLRSAERENSTWQYTLGALAIDLLAERSGIDAPFEFYRSLRPVRLDSVHGVTLAQTWQGTFADVFGISHDEFYREYDAFQDKLPGRQIEAKSANERTLAGKLVQPDGSPVTDVWVTANPQEQGVSVHWDRRARTDANGAFELSVPSNTGLELRIDLADVDYSVDIGCSLWIGPDDVVVFHPWEAGIVRVGLVDPTPITVEIPPAACNLYIGGELVDADGEGLPNVSLGLVGANVATGLTNRDGSFRIPVPEPGWYRLTVWFGGCLVYYKIDGVTGSQDSAAEIDVDAVSVTGLRFQLSENPCANSISGRLLNEQGGGVSGEKIYAQTDRANPAFGFTDDDGYFSIAVPKRGSYYLYIPVSRGCWMVYRHGIAAGLIELATYLEVDEENVTGIRFTIPADACSRTIDGRVLDDKGRALPDIQVWASTTRVAIGVSTTDREGRFSIPVTEPVKYLLRVTVAGCDIFLGASGATSSLESAHRMSVSGDTVIDIEFRLPQNPASFCD